MVIIATYWTEQLEIYINKLTNGCFLYYSNPQIQLASNCSAKQYDILADYAKRLVKEQKYIDIIAISIPINSLSFILSTVLSFLKNADQISWMRMVFQLFIKEQTDCNKLFCSFRLCLSWFFYCIKSPHFSQEIKIFENIVKNFSSFIILHSFWDEWLRNCSSRWWCLLSVFLKFDFTTVQNLKSNYSANFKIRELSEVSFPQKFHLLYALAFNLKADKVESQTRMYLFEEWERQGDGVIELVVRISFSDFHSTRTKDKKWHSLSKNEKVPACSELTCQITRKIT